MSFAYMPFYTGDYYRDTRHLSMLQHGAYRQLLDHCWDQRGPLPLDMARCFRICGAVSKEEQDAVAGIVSEFFIQMEDGHYNRRMQLEIERCASISGARSDAAHTRWKARESIKAIDGAVRYANAVHVHSKSNASGPSPSPSPSPSQELKTIVAKATHADKSAAGSDSFDAFWKAYPKKVGKDAAAKAFAKRKPDSALLASMVSAIARQKLGEQWRRDGGQFIPHPATWLNEGRWQDESVSVESDLSELFRRGQR